MTAPPASRFDDLSPGGTSFALSGPVEEFVAHAPSAVVPALLAAEEAARAGRWVAGFLTYEAAAGLDSAQPVCPWPDAHPLATLPLVWFAAFRDRHEVEPPPTPAGDGPAWQLDRDREWHHRRVEQAHRAIADGDYYQVNLTARLNNRVHDAAELYARLLAGQRGAYNALITTPEHTVVSASPELFFDLSGRTIVTRPMKGTARRGRWSAEDDEIARILRNSTKEVAENVMIVDLLRNDLGRIAETGSVAVTSLCSPERYPTVWQLTSTIRALLPAQTGLTEILRALFPSGSVTGAPKIAAMHGIADLERRPRGVYCGATGYLAPHPQHLRARFSVAIRTATIQNSDGYAEYGSGGGITIASRPGPEWMELLTKTRVLSSPRAPEVLLETMRFEPPSTIVDLPGHLKRLATSAEYFGFAFREPMVRKALLDAVSARDSAARVTLRLQSTGGVVVEVSDIRPERPVPRLVPAGEPVNSSDQMLFHKHGDRSRYERLRSDRPGADDVLLWNERGHVTETTIANIAVLLDGRWWTPSLESGLLPGVRRARLLAAGVLQERRLTLDDVLRAGALDLLSSLRGRRPARLIRDHAAWFPALAVAQKVAGVCDQATGCRP